MLVCETVYDITHCFSCSFSGPSSQILVFHHLFMLVVRRLFVCCVSITGVDKGSPGPQWPGKKFFFVKIEGLLEPVVLNLSFRVLSNAMFTSERRY